MRAHTGQLAREGGSVTLGFAVVAAGLLIMVLLVVYAGRISQAEAEVRSAATAAARAASLRQTAAGAQADAHAVAEEDLAAAGLGCQRLQVAVHTDELVPGGQVVADVVCTASLADLALLGVPGSQRVAATAAAPVDTYRGGQP